MTLLDTLRLPQARIGIVGLGYVGVPLAIRFAAAGCRVTGFDIDAARLAALNGGRSPFIHIPDAKIAGMVGEGFTATADFRRIGELDAIMICVPTPLTRQREPDMRFITATMAAVAPHLRPDQVLSLESTTYPGTTDEVIRPYIESRGLRVGENFHLVYSPEREDPGNPRFDTQTIPKIVGGATPACLAVGKALYEIAVDTVVPVSSTAVAELTKLLENIHRSVNIGLVNEMKVIADRMGIDIFEVIDAAATKPFGFTPYYPGPGLGGHCIPVDPFYLTWKAREFGYTPHFIELAGEINRDMPQWVVGRVAFALNRQSRALNGSRILALGITYKRDIDDMRESPAVRVMELLRDAGAVLDYSDPNVPVFPPIARDAFDLRSVALTPETLASYDCVVLLTDHSAFDYAAILEHAPLIVDTRGRFRSLTQKVVRA